MKLRERKTLGSITRARATENERERENKRGRERELPYLALSQKLREKIECKRGIGKGLISVRTSSLCVEFCSDNFIHFCICFTHASLAFRLLAQLSVTLIHYKHTVISRFSV